MVALVGVLITPYPDIRLHSAVVPDTFLALRRASVLQAVLKSTPASAIGSGRIVMNLLIGAAFIHALLGTTETVELWAYSSNDTMMERAPWPDTMV